MLNLSIKNKLRVLLLLPTIVIGVSVFKISYEAYEQKTNIHSLNKLVEVSKRVTTLVHETQKERGMTAGFIGSKGTKFGSKILIQRELVDTKSKQLKIYLKDIDLNNYQEKYVKVLKSAITKLEKRESIRKEVSALNIPLGKALGYYTKMNGEFLDTITVLSSISKDVELTNDISAYANFLLSKERAGIERAVGANTFAKDKFGKGMKEKFNKLISEQNTYLATFKKVANPNTLKVLNETLKGKPVEEVQKMRNIANGEKTIGGFGIDAGVWFATITKKIGLLKKTDDFIGKNLPENELNAIVVAASKLVHETQKERGMTAGFIGSKGTKFDSKIIGQRKLVDNRMKKLKTILAEVKNEKVKETANKMISHVSQRSDIRRQVNGLTIPVGNALKYYTQGNSKIIKIVEVVAQELKSTDVNSYANFLLSKERAGIERAVGANTFAKNKFGKGMKSKWVKLITEQEAFYKAFTINASEKTANFAKKTIKGQYINKVNQMRKIALEANTIGGFNVDSGVWFATITKKIGLLKKVDDKLAKMLLTKSEQKEKNLNMVFLITIFTGIISLIVFIIIGFKIMNDITRAIVGTKEGLTGFFKYLNKETNEVSNIEILNNDEFGEMNKEINDNINKTSKIIEENNNITQNIIKVLERVEKGDLEQKITDRATDDTINGLINIINNMTVNLKNNFEKIKVVLNNYENQDYRYKVDTKDLEKDLLKLANSVNNVGEKTIINLQEEQRKGEKLKDQTSELTNKATQLQDSSNQQAANLEEVAASIEEITGNIVTAGEKTKEMLKSSEEGLKFSKDGLGLIQTTTAVVEEINEQQQKINTATRQIEEIAFQTNILSLNAAVEAATAGEHGKGFAVVAQEVRNLAARSAEAAEEIKGLVSESIAKAEQGSREANKTLESFNNVIEKIEHTQEVVTEVTAATQEQETGIAQINSAISELDTFTQENAKLAMETSNISTEVETISNSLIEEVEKNKY